MSIKRYAYGDFGMDFLDNGEFVLHSKYAALEARHNALWNFYEQLENAMFGFEKEARVERMKRVAAERFAARYKEIATDATSLHNALVEAVAKMFAAHEAWTQKGGASYPDWADGRARYDAARAEVDRLLGRE